MLTGSPLSAVSALPAPVTTALENFPACINRHSPGLWRLSFHAKPGDRSLFDAPTIAVDVWGGGHLTATYKMNIGFFAAPGATGCLILSPLVVKWTENGAYRKAGDDVIVIDHCTNCLLGLHKHENLAAYDMLLTTGYLTVQRGGMAFFASLGWKAAMLLTNKTREGGGGSLLRSVARRIDAISIADRTLPEEQKTIRFAYRHFPARSAGYV